MKYIIYYSDHEFIILEHMADGMYEYFAQCETKAAAELLISVLNGGEAK